MARALRSLGEDPRGVRVSFVEVVELQRRGVPHFHAVIRLGVVLALTTLLGRTVLFHDSRGLFGGGLDLPRRFRTSRSGRSCWCWVGL